MKKKLLAMLLAGCMVLSMTACGEKETPAETTEIMGRKKLRRLIPVLLEQVSLSSLENIRGLLTNRWM